jgi:predicted dehydrogenase
VRRVLIVGGGKMGLLRGAIVNATRTHSVVGIVDTSLQSRRFTAWTGIPAPLFRTLDAALDKTNANTCFVCTPPGAHAAVTTRAFDAGLDCFIEKPLAIDPDESDELVRQAAERGRAAVVGYVRRFSPVVRRLEAEIARAGGARRIRAVMLSPQFVGRSDEGAARGGVDWDLLVHVADAVLYLVGGKPVAAAVESVRRRRSEAVLASGRLGGVEVSLEADWACTGVRKVEMGCEVEAADGSTLACDEDMVWRPSGDGSRDVVFHRRDTPPPWFDVAGSEFSEEIRDCLESFSTGRMPSGTSLAEAAAVDRFIVEVLAAESGAWERP